MCGIYGYINSKSGENIKKEVLIKMGKAIEHRGPEDTGFYIKGNIGFGHNRLSIIDLDADSQPISNENQTIWLACNGEIYNYKALVEDLIKKGHSFKTGLDCEVLVHLYEEEGMNLLDKIKGMFAFILWDAKRKEIFLVRDRLGIKPLYYIYQNGVLIFASELKSILSHPEFNEEIDFVSLRHYFIYGYIPDPMSIFKKINKLAPASYISFSGNDISLKTYWSSFPMPRLKDPRQISEELLILLQTSVYEHLMADVPVGVFLSGGIDSSIIAYLSMQKNPGIKIFNISFEDSEYDDSEYAELISRRSNPNFFKRKIPSNYIIENARRIIEVLDEPLADPSFVPTYLLSSFAKEHVKVCLSGDGADELFAGYPSYFGQQVAEIYKRIPGFIRENILNNLVELLPIRNSNNKNDFLLRLFISAVDYDDIGRDIIWFGPMSPLESNKLFRKGQNKFEEDSDIFRIVREYIKGHKFDRKIEKYLFIDRRFFLNGDILVKIDRASMANSLEVRVPFLDHRIVEFVNILPTNFKVRFFTNKFILRKIFRNKIPDRIIFRTKKGFSFPLSKLLKKGLLDEFGDLLSEDFIRHQGLFEYEYIQKTISEHLRTKKDNHRILWSIIMFQTWFNKYLN